MRIWVSRGDDIPAYSPFLPAMKNQAGMEKLWLILPVSQEKSTVFMAGTEGHVVFQATGFYRVSISNIEQGMVNNEQGMTHVEMRGSLFSFRVSYLAACRGSSFWRRKLCHYEMHAFSSRHAGLDPASRNVTD
jgi:hypothetical protein